ncbi:MAG: hypothetical protein AAF633_24145, partial [Chloroflexota bacterium]
MNRVKGTVSVIAVSLIALCMVLMSSQSADAAGYRVGHTWKFTYDHSSMGGEVEVTIARYEISTHNIVQIYHQETFGVDCNENKYGNGEVDCDLDIQGNIEEAYANTGYSGMMVNSVEGYSDFYVETYGIWTALSLNSPTTVVSHPSITYGMKAKSGKVTTYTDFSNTVSKGISPSYSPSGGVPYRMESHFQQSNGNFFIEYSVAESAGKETVLGSESVPSQLYHFLLSPSTITISPPAGFDLDR